MVNLSYYPYFSPSQAVAGVAAGLFGVSLVLGFYQTIKYKAWIWLIMILAVAMETVGFAARIASAGDPTNRNVFIVQFCLVVLAPVMMAGIVYVVFGRILYHVVPPEHRTLKLLWLPPRWITPIFVFFDIFALFMQLIGAVLISATQVTDSDYLNKINKGKDLASAGVIIQLVAFGLFTLVGIRFHFVSKRFIDDFKKRFQAAPGNKFVTMEGTGRKFRPQWRYLLYAVNIACAMILIRTIYREVDFEGGKGGSLDRSEAYVYGLDAIPMYIVTVLFILVPPGAYVQMSWRQTKDYYTYPTPTETSHVGDAIAMGTRQEV